MLLPEARTDYTLIPRSIPYIETPSGQKLQDWDCAEAIDLPLFESTLRYIHRHGSVPPDMHSKEDQNEVGESGVAKAQIERHHDEIAEWMAELKLPPSIRTIDLTIIDGFLLYADPNAPSIPTSITDLLDLKLFLRSDHDRTKTRREARKGYVTLEGFWEDPEGYVDDVVWPNYVREHKWMFEDGNVDEGELSRQVGEQHIAVGPGKGEKSMSELWHWSTEKIKDAISKHISD